MNVLIKKMESENQLVEPNYGALGFIYDGLHIFN